MNMFTESEIQNFKKIFLDEICCTSGKAEAEKIFDEKFEKTRSINQHDDLDSICEKLEMKPELKAYFKDNFVFDPTLPHEEHFKIGMRLGKEFFHIEEKQH